MLADLAAISDGNYDIHLAWNSYLFRNILRDLAKIYIAIAITGATSAIVAGIFELMN